MTEANGVAVPETVGVVVAVPLSAGLRIAIVGRATVVNVTGTEVEPPGLEAVTVSVFGPTGRVVLNAQANVPDAEAVVVQSVTGPGPVITTWLPGVAVPAMVGVVVVDTFTGPVTVRLGGPTAVKVFTSVAVPPGLLTTAVTLCGPAANVRLEQAYVPETLAVVTHDWLLGPSTVTEANGVAVPEIVGVVVAVPLSAGDRIATVGGAKAVNVVGTAVVPPGPEAVTVTVVTPAVSVTGQENVPDAEAVVVQSVTGPGPVITITLPGVAVPATGCVKGPNTGVATVRLGGPATVKVLAVVAVPPTLLAVAVTVLGPDGKVKPVTEYVPVVGSAVVVKFPPAVANTTVAPGVAVPETVLVAAGCVVLVAGLRIATVGGTTAVKLAVVVEQPPVVQAVIVSVVGPAGTLTEQENTPEASAVAVQSVTGPGPVMTTSLPGVAVPEMTGAVLVVGPVGATVSEAGIVGATAVKVFTSVAVPPGLLTTAVTL